MRLTEKRDGLYIPSKGNDFLIEADDGSNACRLLQKIGTYEDIEEKIGIKLDILYKAITQGVYVIMFDTIHEVKSKGNISYAFSTDFHSLEVEDTYGDTWFFNFSDYGKKENNGWALTREELE